jgi:hypothetical protein
MWCIVENTGSGIEDTTRNFEKFCKRNYQGQSMGHVIMTGAYVDTFEHILDTKACPGSCAIATIAASTMTTSTWQNFGQKYQKS